MRKVRLRKLSNAQSGCQEEKQQYELEPGQASHPCTRQASFRVIAGVTVHTPPRNGVLSVGVGMGVDGFCRMALESKQMPPLTVSAQACDREPKYMCVPWGWRAGDPASKQQFLTPKLCSNASDSQNELTVSQHPEHCSECKVQIPWKDLGTSACST